MKYMVLAFIFLFTYTANADDRKEYPQCYDPYSEANLRHTNISKMGMPKTAEEIVAEIQKCIAHEKEAEKESFIYKLFN